MLKPEDVTIFTETERAEIDRLIDEVDKKLLASLGNLTMELPAGANLKLWEEVARLYREVGWVVDLQHALPGRNGKGEPTPESAALKLQHPRIRHSSHWL